VFMGIRGGAAWDRVSVAAAIEAAADLGQRSGEWPASMDINPLICDANGCVAVDALLIV